MLLAPPLTETIPSESEATPAVTPDPEPVEPGKPAAEVAPIRRCPHGKRVGKSCFPCPNTVATDQPLCEHGELPDKCFDCRFDFRGDNSDEGWGDDVDDDIYL